MTFLHLMYLHPYSFWWAYLCVWDLPALTRELTESFFILVAFLVCFLFISPQTCHPQGDHEEAELGTNMAYKNNKNKSPCYLQPIHEFRSSDLFIVVILFFAYSFLLQLDWDVSISPRVASLEFPPCLWSYFISDSKCHDLLEGGNYRWVGRCSLVHF